MVFVRPFALLLILILFPLSAAAQSNPQDNPIVQRAQSFVKAYNAGDAAAIGAFYTEDAALFPPRTPAVVGREAISAFFARAFEGGAGNLRLNFTEIRQLGPEFVIEIGETMVTVGEQEVHGRYLHIWALVNGEWFLRRDMFHILEVQ
jgi:uncharacterized protein (TIGR02246 family)